jgi:hypothetical protein
MKDHKTNAEFWTPGAMPTTLSWSWAMEKTVTLWDVNSVVINVTRYHSLIYYLLDSRFFRHHFLTSSLCRPLFPMAAVIITNLNSLKQHHYNFGGQKSTVKVSTRLVPSGSFQRGSASCF